MQSEDERQLVYLCAFCGKAQPLSETSNHHVLRLGREPICQTCYDKAVRAVKQEQSEDPFALDPHLLGE